MKLVIQICCLNEEKTLPRVLGDLPRSLPGFSEIEWLVIDDGSTDATMKVAKEHGVDQIVRHERSLGLARAFQTGIAHSLSRNADVIVHTDGDNQYHGGDIPLLVAPILEKRADVTIGVRPIWQIDYWSFAKKILQMVGSATVSIAAGTTVKDATCGFRAHSKKAAQALDLHSDYTYTLESLIQLSSKGMRITNVPIRNPPPPARESRLIRTTADYVRRSATAIVRSLVTYRNAEGGESRRLSGSFILYSLNCGFMLAVKLSLMGLLSRYFAPTFAYFAVHLVTLIASYTLHSKLAFAVKCSWEGFLKYALAVMSFKAVDYGLFISSMALFQTPPTFAVLVATAVTFLLRFALVRLVLSTNVSNRHANSLH